MDKPAMTDPAASRRSAEPERAGDDVSEAALNAALPDAPLDMPTQRLKPVTTPRRLFLRLRLAVQARSGS